MTAHSYSDMMAALGVERSYSRPRVSNDNAFSESQFKTLKYSPSYPKRFDGPEHARNWGQQFFPHYNQRPHGGLALFTPEDLIYQRVDAVANTHQRAMDEHFRRHPERYVNGKPIVKRPPAFVAINPDDGIETAGEMINRPGALRPAQTPVEICLPEVVT